MYNQYYSKEEQYLFTDRISVLQELKYHIDHYVVNRNYSDFANKKAETTPLVYYSKPKSLSAREFIFKAHIYMI